MTVTEHYSSRSTVTEQRRAASTVGVFSGLTPLLARASWLVRASTYSGSGDWLDEIAANDVKGYGGRTPEAEFIGPDDGLPALRLVSAKTNEADADASLMSTPHVADYEATSTIEFRVRCRSIGDLTVGGLIDRTVALRWERDEDPELTYLDCNFQEDGYVQAEVFDGSVTIQHNLGPGTLDVHVYTGIGVLLTLDDGGDYTVQAKVLDDGSWVNHGSPVTGSGPAELGTDGRLLFMVGKGIGWGCEVLVDGSLQADLDLDRDADAGDTSVVHDQGRTWTVGGHCGIVSNRVPSFVGSDDGLNVADNDALDVAAGDYTMFFDADILYRVVTGAAFYLSKLSNFGFGSTAVGHTLADLQAAGGFVAIAAENANLGFAVAAPNPTPSLGRHLIAERRTGSVYDLIVDGTVINTANVSTVGSMNTATALSLAAGTASAWHNAGLFKSALTDDELDTLMSDLGVS